MLGVQSLGQGHPLLVGASGEWQPDGFRVNVDGSYLGETVGYQTQDVEVRKGDSIRVFVELTSHVQHADVPKLVEDNLVFTLESGVQQKLNLNAYSWDALLLRDKRVSQDEVIQSSQPIVVYGGIRWIA